MSKPVHIRYFVHGTTADNERGISSGWKDVALSVLGQKQAVDLKAKSAEAFDVIFCSDLKRAIDSATLTWENAVKIIQDERLRECNYGDLNGAQSKRVDAMMTECIDVPFPKGESYHDVEKRMRSFLDDLKKRYAGKHIAIVAHRAPQLALDVILKGKTWERAMQEDWRHTKSWQPGWDYLLK